MSAPVIIRIISNTWLYNENWNGHSTGCNRVEVRFRNITRAASIQLVTLLSPPKLGIFRCPLDGDPYSFLVARPAIECQSPGRLPVDQLAPQFTTPDMNIYTWAQDIEPPQISFTLFPIDIDVGRASEAGRPGCWKTPFMGRPART